MKYLTYLFLFTVQFTFAQSELPKGFGDYHKIKEVDAGQIFAQIYFPPIFKEKIIFDNVLLFDENQHLLTNLEKGKDYEIETLIVEIEPRKVNYSFEIITDTTFVNSKINIIERLEIIEPLPEYENQIITERQLVLPRQEAPFLFEWSNRRRVCLDLLQNRKDAIALGFIRIEIPAKYCDVQKRVLKKDNQWWTETIADTIELKNEIAYFESKLIDKIEITPAVLDTFQILHFKNKPLNAQFSIIKTQVITEKHFYSEWEENLCHLCGGNDSKVQHIKKSLKEKGYDIININNVFDLHTKRELIQFQKDNNLPIGSLDTKTLKLLGF